MDATFAPMTPPSSAVSTGGGSPASGADVAPDSAWASPGLFMSPPPPSRVAAPAPLSPMPPLAVPGMPSRVAPPPPKQPAAPRPAAPRPRPAPRVSLKSGWEYFLGKGPAKRVLITRALVALVVMVATTVVLIAASPRSVRVIKTDADGVTTSRPCVPTAFGIGAVSFGLALGAPYAADFMRPSRAE